MCLKCDGSGMVLKIEKRNCTRVAFLCGCIYKKFLDRNGNEVRVKKWEDYMLDKYTDDRFPTPKMIGEMHAARARGELKDFEND